MAKKKRKSIWAMFEDSQNPYVKQQKQREREEKLDWSKGVERVRDGYSNSDTRTTATTRTASTGTPDNNSPGTNVEREDDVNMQEVPQNESMAVPKSVWSENQAAARKEKAPVEADRSKEDSPEANDWVYSYTPGQDSGQDQQMASFLQAQGIRMNDNPSRDDIARAVAQWREQNGYAALDNDALRKMARDMGASR